MDDETKPEGKIEEPIQLDDTNPIEIAKAPQSFSPQKGIAIALGAGVARGWSHIGVLRALDEADIPISMISGTSIGALVGGCYLAGKLDELEQFACSITKTSMLRFLDFTLSSNGLISGNRLADRMDEHIGHIQIQDLDRRFVAVATDIATGSEIWLNSGSLTQAIRASYALPGIFQPVMHYDRQLVDGALTNPIPVSACRAYEEQIVLAVKLDRDVLGRTAVVRSSSFPETLQGLDADAEAENATNKWLAFNLGMFGKKSNTTKIGFTGVMIEAFNIIQDRIVRSRLAGDPPDFIIRPKIGDMGLTEFHRAQEAIDAGYKTTKEQIKVLEDTGFRSLLT